MSLIGRSWTGGLVGRTCKVVMLRRVLMDLTGRNAKKVVFGGGDGV